MSFSPKDEFDVSTLQGLSEKEATRRLETNGYNELPSAQPRTLFAIAYEVMREPMFLMLLACGGIYLVLGEILTPIQATGVALVIAIIILSLRFRPASA